MKCGGTLNYCGAECDCCCRYQNDCDGHPDWGDYNGQWLPLEVIEELEEIDGTNRGREAFIRGGKK